MLENPIIQFQLVMAHCFVRFSWEAIRARAIYLKVVSNSWWDWLCPHNHKGMYNTGRPEVHRLTENKTHCHMSIRRVSYMHALLYAKDVNTWTTLIAHTAIRPIPLTNSLHANPWFLGRVKWGERDDPQAAALWEAKSLGWSTRRGVAYARSSNGKWTRTALDLGCQKRVLKMLSC